MSPFRTVHIVHFYSSPGGIEVLSSRIIGGFPGREFRVFTIRPPVAGAVDVYEDTGVSRSYGSKSNVRAMISLLGYARRNRGDIFHLFNVGPFFLLAVRLAGVDSIVYSIRGTRYWDGFLQKLVRKSLWGIVPDKKISFISNSEYSKQVFHEKISRGTEIRVLYNPAGDSRFTPPATRIRRDALKIIYAGRLNTGKNLEKWVELAGKLHHDLKNTEFEIYGSGPLEEPLKAQIRALEAESYMSVKGFRKDIENVYREADFMLFLSEYESFGNVVVECILCGTPVIAADIPSMREIFLDYPDFLVPSDGDLGQQIHRKLIDHDHLSALALEASDNFRNRFSVKSHIAALENIYSSFDD